MTGFHWDGLCGNYLQGWVADHNDHNEDVVVILKDRRGNSYRTGATLFRPSLVDRGVSQHGFCGFQVPADAFQLGDFLSLRIYSSTKLIAISDVFAGNPFTWSKMIAREYPRADNDVLELSRRELNEIPDLARLKILLVRLRRAKRGSGYLLKFSGTPGIPVKRDLRAFRRLIGKHFSLISQHTNTRFMLSFSETFIDFSPRKYTNAANVASALYLAERFHKTQILVSGNLLDAQVFDSSRQIPNWGGLLTNRVEADDAYFMWLTRFLESTIEVSVENLLALELVKRMVSSPSLFSSEANKSSFYENYLPDYLSEIGVRLEFFTRTLSQSKLN